MKLKDYALIAEVLSAAAIVASLIFVGLQIQQNNRISQVDAYQARIDSITVNLRQLGLSSELSEISVRYMAEGIGALSQVEIFRLSGWQRATLRNMESAYYRYQQGFLERESIDSIIDDAARFYPMWTDLGVINDFEIPEFKDEIEQYISTGENL